MYAHLSYCVVSMEQGFYSSSYHKQQLHVADLPQLQQELVYCGILILELDGVTHKNLFHFPLKNFNCH